MATLALWELSCPSKDAILWTSLDGTELVRLARSAPAPAEPACPGLPRSVETHAMATIHALTHDRNPFSEELQRELQETHAEARLWVAATPVESVPELLNSDWDSLPFPLAGLVWAVLTDARPAVRGIECRFLWDLMRRGLKALAFGRVELIPV